MNTLIKTFGFASILALGAGACASDAPGAPGEGSGGEGSGEGSGTGSGSGTATPQLDASGNYTMQSTFDVSTNLPGTVGTVVNDFIGATTGANQPTEWLLQQIVAQLPSGTTKTLLNGVLPLVSGYLNDRVQDWAPDFVTTFDATGTAFGDMAKHLGFNETLNVSKSGADYTAIHTATGVHFNVNNVGSDYAFSTYQLPNVVATNVGVTMDATGAVTIATHKMAYTYGKILRIGLDAEVIPSVDSAAHNLNQLLADKIDCTIVGGDLNDALVSQLGFGPGADVMTAACTAGLTLGASFLYSEIDNIDTSALEFDINGTAKAIDKNNDEKVDALQTGKWAGTMSYSGTAAPLGAATFTGSKM